MKVGDDLAAGRRQVPFELIRGRVDAFGCLMTKRKAIVLIQ